MQGSGGVATGTASDVAVQMAFACENVSTDPMQRVSFHTVVEQLHSPAFPVATPLLYMVFAFQRRMPGFLVQCAIEVIPPQGDPIAAQAIADLAFRPDQMTQRAIVGFQGILWPSDGEYVVRFTSRGTPIASFVLRVVKTPPAPSQPPSR
jgi:hypothetical protein